MKKTICALVTVIAAGLAGCSEKPKDLNEVALKEYQEARQKFSDKEWKTTWSADRRKKAVSYQDGDYMYGFVLNADETECKNLSNYARWDSSPTYLPDGRITWTSEIGENIEIYVMDKDGSNLKQLTNNPVDDKK